MQTPSISELLRLTVDANGSDLHLATGYPPIIRVDGDLEALELPLLQADIVAGLIREMMDERSWNEFQIHKQYDFSFEIEGISRFRINAFYQNLGPSAVCRVIPHRIRTLEELSCPPLFAELAKSHQGLILVTGPTGSGKSTTLAAIIDHINRTLPAHVLTIEDPIEYVHQGQRALVNQREVFRDTMSFNDALRAALREDPDVILVGEMRDLETIRLALTAAETGHLVFATLHTNSAAKTIDRIIDVFPGDEKAIIRSMLSESLRAVVAQMLVKRAGGGRVAVWEIMIGTPAIRNLIREGQVPQMYSAIQTGRREGMQTTDQHLQNLLERGQITPELALEKAQNKNTFSHLLSSVDGVGLN